MRSLYSDGAAMVVGDTIAASQQVEDLGGAFAGAGKAQSEERIVVHLSPASREKIRPFLRASG